MSLVTEKKYFDVIVIGAGAAGMMTARTASLAHKRVAILEHNSEVGRKILISGGGRCNFTNLYTLPSNYVSENPHFCISALKRFSPGDFITLMEAAKIPYHEKRDGQLFCTHKARDLVNWFVDELKKENVSLATNCLIQKIEKTDLFSIQTSQGVFTAPSLVVATGGLSVPKVGASDLGYKIASQFGHTITELSPALDGFVWPQSLQGFAELSGYSLPAKISLACGQSFTQSLLMTHKGLSGPVALDASLYWKRGENIVIHLLPSLQWHTLLKDEKTNHGGIRISTLLNRYFSSKFTETWMRLKKMNDSLLAQTPLTTIEKIADNLTNWTWSPSGTVGYNKAEVTRGGVSTFEIDSRTMQSKKIPGLYFVGEVVDVSGQLGGFNFQWAWASGHAAGQAVSL